MNELIPDIKPADLVTAYQAMRADIEEIHERMQRVTGTGAHYFGSYFIPCEINGNMLSSCRMDLERALKTLTVNCWGSLFRKIKNFLPEREIRIIERQIEKGEVPEFAEIEIDKILMGFVTRGEEFKKAMIEDIFEFLRPRHTGLKTNDRTALTDKAIIPYAVTGRYINDHRENNLWDVDKIFHLLDGAGMPKYPGNLITQIKDGIREGKHAAETEYFAVKWFKNHNLHIKFKRMDLIFQINKLAGCDKLAKQKSAGGVPAPIST